LLVFPLRPDRPQPELPHQPPDAPTADRNYLPPARAPLAVAGCRRPDRRWKIPVGAVFRRSSSSADPSDRGRVIEAAARNLEQRRALPGFTGQPRLRRDHRPPLSTREMAGLPGKKIALDLQLTDLLPMQIVDHLLRIVDPRRLVATRKTARPHAFTSSCFQLADHSRMNFQIPPTAPPGSSPPPKVPPSPTRALKAAAVLLPSLHPRFMPLWTGSGLLSLLFPPSKKTGAAAYSPRRVDLQAQGDLPRMPLKRGTMPDVSSTRTPPRCQCTVFEHWHAT